MSPNGRKFSVVPTLLLSLVVGTMLGVLLLLLFGKHVGNPDTVSVVNAGIPGTTVVDKSAKSAAGTTSDTSTTSASATSSESATKTPVEGEAASGSAGEAANTTANAAAPEQSLEQTVTDTSFKGTGAEIYVQACQSCHMPGGKGAQGAGIYPALAGNPKLKTAQYPVSMVLFGNGGMPSFGHYMNDQQISDVVNYVRSELNKNTDKVTPDDVKKMRQPGQHYMIFGEAAG